jgi:hypothetical protein
VRDLDDEGIATTSVVSELILGKALGWLWDPLGDVYSASDDNPVPTLGVASGWEPTGRPLSLDSEL